MTNTSSERFSPLVLARIVGIVSLIGIVAGAFDIGYVRSALIVPGDAAATIHNIASHEALFRLGFAAHIVVLIEVVVVATLHTRCMMAVHLNLRIPFPLTTFLV